MKPAARLLPTLAAVAAVALVTAAPLDGRSWSTQGQEAEGLVVRPAPPKLEDFEIDKNGDGVPDGWYNARDVKVVDEGGVIGEKFLRFECVRPGRPARLSRAFGVDGRKYEAIVLGIWVRVEKIQSGERLGEEPGLMIDFLGDELRQTTRGSLGPWTSREFGAVVRWTRVAKRIPVPPGTHDAILSVGLLGATGVLDVDGMTIDLVPVGGTETTNLVKNPDFEFGDPEPDGWISHNARRGFPGFQSPAALELKTESRCSTGLALPVEGFGSVVVSVQATARGLRGGGGAAAMLFFVDEDGRPLPGGEGQSLLFQWSGTFGWREDNVVARVPERAIRAVLQVDKFDSQGTIKLDDVSVVADNPQSGTWTPYHVGDETDGWLPLEPAPALEPKSALDFSFLVEGPAGKSGPVVVTKEGRLGFAKSGNRARFFGVQLLPPTPFLAAEKADALAERLARSGVNLVRFGDLDTPLGPVRSLFDDTRDDTKTFDEVSLARFDHLIAALKARGIYFALELQGARRFRTDDGVTAPGALPPGGGPAAVFDPALTKLADDSARALLAHVNPETGLALRNDPALAWVTISGEVSLFNLLDDPGALPVEYAKAYHELLAKNPAPSQHRTWQSLEEARWKKLAATLREDGLKAPVAGVSSWRREPLFREAQAAAGLDLIDDRLYWSGPTWMAPRFRSMLWSTGGGIVAMAAEKRRTDRPYVVGQWCDFTQDVWASPYEAAEQLLAATAARTEDWDALVRRGLFVYPTVWGSAAPGTSGGEDIFQIPEVANAAPHVFSLWPHAASIYLRGGVETRDRDRDRDKPAPRPRTTVRRTGPKARKRHVPGWEPERGRLIVETPYTQGVAGWPGEEKVEFPELTIEVENAYATVVASSVGDEPIGRARRLLVTAIARISPTGFLWVDDWRRETADPGRPPLLAEPVLARITWRRKGTVKAYALDASGARAGEAKATTSNDATTLVIDGTAPSVHWELAVE